MTKFKEMFFFCFVLLADILWGGKASALWCCASGRKDEINLNFYVNKSTCRENPANSSRVFGHYTDQKMGSL